MCCSPSQLGALGMDPATGAFLASVAIDIGGKLWGGGAPADYDPANDPARVVKIQAAYDQGRALHPNQVGVVMPWFTDTVKLLRCWGTPPNYPKATLTSGMLAVLRFVDPAVPSFVKAGAVCDGLPSLYARSLAWGAADVLEGKHISYPPGTPVEALPATPVPVPLPGTPTPGAPGAGQPLATAGIGGLSPVVVGILALGALGAIFAARGRA